MELDLQPTDLLDLQVGIHKEPIMIYQYHFDFKDEKVLQSDLQKNIRGTIPVIEDAYMVLSETFQLSYPWIPASDREIRYLSNLPFSKENHDISWAMEIRDVLILFWSKESGEIRYKKGIEYSAERLQFWLYHTFFPVMLELRGIYHILHVGSVEIVGKPVLFSAHSFGGKSTMTDYFIQRGHSMLSDDALGIEKIGIQYHAIPSYPFHRPYRKPEELGYPVANFATEPKPLHAVYLLEKSDPDATVEIVELKGIEKFKAFHYSTFIDLDFMKRERFEFFSEMAKSVPVYKVIVPWDLERIEEVYEKIVLSVKR